MHVLEDTAPVITSAVTGIALAQAPGSGVPMTLSGALAGGPYKPPRRVLFTGVTDTSGVGFVIVGKDRNGAALTETVMGPAASPATTRSIYVYSSVASITPNGTSANTLSIGYDGESITPWRAMGNYQGNYHWTLRAFIATLGNSANFDIEATLMDMFGQYNDAPGATDTPDDIFLLTTVAQTAGFTLYNAYPLAFIRLKVHSGGPVTMRILSSRTA
jgi:hypothetical protein